MQEFKIIEKYLKPLTKNHPSALLLQDDAAVISPKSNTQIVLSCDNLVENVHFLENTTPENIAKKLAGRNLSDIAAMGATPLYTMISATLNEKCDETWIAEFCQSLERTNNRYNICVIGGDTSYHKGPINLSMTVIGEIDKYKAVTRAKASIDDDVYVTGTIGDAAIGLLVARDNEFNLTREKKVFFENKYHSPVPQIEIGQKLINFANSMTDISDGILLDLNNIASTSNVEIHIDITKIPLSKHMKELQKSYDLYENIITGGDDYELLFTASKSFKNEIAALAKDCDVKITKIGTVKKEGNSAKIFNKNKEELFFTKAGYIHQEA